MTILIPVKSVRPGMVVALRQSTPGQTGDFSRCREVVGSVDSFVSRPGGEWIVTIEGWPVLVPEGAMIEMLPA